MIRFVKMHGAANDYVYVDAAAHPRLEERWDLGELSRIVSDRHRGIGSDGLILVCPPAGKGAHVRMRMFNSDGSESEMCGNGVRCVAKFAHDRLGVRARPMRVETGRGVLTIDYTLGPSGKVVSATVDMGEPILAPAHIPVELGGLAPGPKEHEYALRTSAGAWHAAFVSMGNPHAVIFSSPEGELTPDRLRALDLARAGPPVETHAAFPRRINAHFVAVRSRSAAVMRTWERGAGATMACGTGACASVVAGVQTGRLDGTCDVEVPGGMLRIELRGGRVFMTGPAEDAFEGEWSPTMTAS